MSEREILDAPENGEDDRLVIPKRAVIWTMLALFIGFSLISLFAKLDYFDHLPNYRILYFNFDAIIIILLAFISFVLYFFVANLQYQAKDWYRIMVVSVTMVFFSILLTDVIVNGSSFLTRPWNALKAMSFLSLTAGGGCSIAVQFLRRKQYAFFLVAMIMTLLFFALINYL